MQSLEKVNGEFTKNGRDLQKLLGSRKDYARWAKAQIKKLTLRGDFGYQSVTERSHTYKPKITHYFTEAAAQRIAVHTGVRTEAAAMVKDNFAMQSMTMGQLVNNPEQAVLFFSQIAADQAKRLEEKEL